MAEHLASIFGTEKDRVNCPFYFKIGACRHGDRCSRAHNRPTISQTMLLKNMYQNPVVTAPLGIDGLPIQVDERYVQENYEDFYEDVFEEVGQFGEIENLNVCDNIADHLVGNVYIKFKDEEACAKALQSLQGRFYDGRPIIAEFSPVTDFREATCRQYEENTCNRGGYCNFMHLKPISKELRKRLFGRYGRRRSPEREPERDRGGDRGGDRYGGDRDRRDFRDRGGDRGGDRGRDRDRGGQRRERENSAERRAKIAAWNREREETGGGGGGGGGGYAPPPPSGGYGQPPGGGGGYGGGDGYAGGGYGGGGGGGGGYGGGYGGGGGDGGGYGGAPAY